jgi:hypothetical protein
MLQLDGMRPKHDSQSMMKKGVGIIVCFACTPHLNNKGTKPPNGNENEAEK